MKLRNLILTVLAVTSLLAACKQEKPVFGVSADKTAVEFNENGGTVAVQITTAQDWKVRISTNGSWILADPSEGFGNSTINFTAQPNDDKDRKTIVTIISGMAMERITFTQAGSLKPGDGLTPETAWSASEANAWIKSNLSDGGISSQKYYIKGKIHKIKDAGTYAESGTYGNATFYISDNGASATDDFYAYRVLYLNGKKWQSGDTDIAVGDDVVIYGYVTLYGSTAETSNKDASGKTSSAYLYSLNGNTGGGGDEDYSKAEPKTVAEFIAAADKSTYYKLTGKVSKFSANYFSFDLTDDSGTIYVYSVLDKFKTDEWKSKIKNGVTITIAGKYEYYASKSQHEVVDAAFLSVEGGGEEEDYTKAEPKTVAEFIQLADENTYYKLTGTVSSFKKGTSSSTGKNYMQFDLADASGASILVYGFLDGEYDKWADKISNGGTAVVAGKYSYYEKNQQHEVVDAAILSFEEGSAPPAGEAKGTGTLDDPYNAAAANQVASALEVGGKSDNVYVKGKISSVKYTFSASFGTATFNISDDGTTSGSQFTCYSVYYLGNRAWAEGDAQIAVGNDVVIYGKLTNYNGTPESSSKEAYIYSLNGQTEITPTDQFGVEKTEITVGATATSATIKVIGNVAWTASSTNARVSPTSGQGAGEVTVSFSENSTQTAKTYTVKVATTADVATKEYTVTITQKAAGSGNTLTISVDFHNQISGFPQSKENNPKDGTHNLEGYDFTFHAVDAYYQAKNNDQLYLIIGKQNSYIQLPAIEGKSLVKVAFLTGANASTNVIVDMGKADGTRMNVNTSALNKGTEYEWEVSGNPGEACRIMVCSAHNAQFQNLVLTYE